MQNKRLNNEMTKLSFHGKTIFIFRRFLIVGIFGRYIIRFDALNKRRKSYNMLSSGVKEGDCVIWHVFRCGRTCTFRRDIRHDFRYRMLVSISPVFDFRYWSNSVTNSSLFGYVNQCRVLSSVQNNRRNVGSTASRYAIAPLDSCKSVISSLGRVFLGPSVYWKP